LAQQAVFLILDGLEPLQLDEVAHDGRLQDTALQAFFTALRRQAKRRSVVLVSSRQKLVELQPWAAGSFLEINLNQLGGGGEIIATGTPEQVADLAHSYTGLFLKKMLGK